MPTFRVSTAPLALSSLVLAASGCAYEPTSGTSTSTRFTQRDVLRAPTLDLVARTDIAATDLARTPGVVVVPAAPIELPAPAVDCHDGPALTVPSEDPIELVSFAGGLEEWAATYTTTNAAGVATTYFVEIDTTGAASSLPREVPLGTRVASFGYELLLVGPSIAEPFLATLGWDARELRDAAVWPAGLDASARVISVHSEPSRCLSEVVLVVESEGGRSVLSIHPGGALGLEVTKLFDLAPVAEGATSVIGYSHLEILEVITSSEGVPLVRVHRSADGASWSLANEIAAWTDGPSLPLAASRTWNGWNVLGEGTVTHLADDGASTPPIVVAMDAGPERAVMTTSSDTTLFASTGSLGALHYGTITLEQTLPLEDASVAWRAFDEMAVMGVGDDGLALRCFRQDTLRAPAP